MGTATARARALSLWLGRSAGPGARSAHEGSQRCLHGVLQCRPRPGVRACGIASCRHGDVTGLGRATRHTLHPRPAAAAPVQTRRKQETQWGQR